MMGAMFKIGDFARLSRVPVKTLRYYDEIGLLKPIGVDRFTRYRYYSLDQLPVLYRILALKELGFSLEQIGQLLEGNLTPGQLRRMLERQRDEIQRQVDDNRAKLQRIDQRLQELDQDGRLREFEVIVKRVEPQWIASIRGSFPGYDEAEPVFNHLFTRVISHVRQYGVRGNLPAMALYHDAVGGDEGIQVEAACILAAPVRAVEPVMVYELAGLEQAASVIHRGSFAGIGRAYSAILSWIPANDWQVSGAARELYLSYVPGGDQTQSVTEIQLPIHRIKERIKMEPKLVNLDAFKVVGMQYIGSNEHSEISQMWEVFNRRSGEIKHLAPMEAAYGVCYEHPTERMEYIAGFKVTELADIPEGMVGKEVPAQMYVVFPCHGLENIGATYHKIINEWLPQNGYLPGGGPDFEYYNDEFDEVAGNGTLYIYFPVKKAV
jgi:predicted transcriptional regulator YdeE/DNA-binding transcriptional MerR regulator